MANQDSRDKLIGELECVMRDLLAAHDQLGQLIVSKRQALSRAEHERVFQFLQQENGRVQAVSELEKRRLQLVGELTLRLVPDARQPMRLDALADHLPEPARGRLLVLRQQLLERMHQIRSETRVARRATEALVQHLQGIMQTIGAVCDGAGVYGHSGAPPKGSLALSTFHVTA